MNQDIKRLRELNRKSKRELARMHKANGGLMPLADYLRWSKDELVGAVMDDERHVHRPEFPTRRIPSDWRNEGRQS
jgi:hypothetical protein